MMSDASCISYTALEKLAKALSPSVFTNEGRRFFEDLPQAIATLQASEQLHQRLYNADITVLDAKEPFADLALEKLSYQHFSSLQARCNDLDNPHSLWNSLVEAIGGTRISLEGEPDLIAFFGPELTAHTLAEGKKRYAERFRALLGPSENAVRDGMAAVAAQFKSRWPEVFTKAEALRAANKQAFKARMEKDIQEETQKPEKDIP